MGPLAVVVVALGILAQSQTTGPQQLLNEADRLAWLTDWYKAMPLYAEAERVATQSGDKRSALYAKFGRIRGQMQMRSLVELSEEIENDLQSPLVTRDSRLQLRGLTVKGDIDLEWNVRLAQSDWELVRQLAGELADSAWENRATGELGLIAFLGGNTGEAMGLVQRALTGATQSGDVGGEIRYVSAIANGLLLAGYTPLAMTYVDRALKTANEHPETGFPFVIYSTKVAVLLELQRADEAERIAQTAMAEAKAGDRRIKQIELSVLLAKIAQKRGQQDLAVGYLEEAVRTARAGDTRRLLGDVEGDLADAYRLRGDLGTAVEHAHAAVDETISAGSQFLLPERLRVLADIYEAQSKFQEADAVYQQATDVIEGIMVNVPSAGAQARLIGAVSNVYTSHFQLAVDRLRDPAKAFAILERARGRAIADVLQTIPSRQTSASPAVMAQTRTISQLQVRLMKAGSPAQRKKLLDQLWEAEQRSMPASVNREIPMTRSSRVELGDVRQSLRPNEVILEYVLSEPRSYCLVIGRRDVTVVTLGSRKQIEQLVDRFTTELRAGKGGPSDAGERLHAAVLAPIAAWQSA